MNDLFAIPSLVAENLTSHHVHRSYKVHEVSWDRKKKGGQSCGDNIKHTSKAAEKDEVVWSEKESGLRSLNKMSAQ